MTDRRERSARAGGDRLPEALGRALRALPRERAGAGFTRGVLDRLEAGGDRAARGGPRFSGLAPGAVRLAAASAVTAVALAGALTVAGPVRERAGAPDRAQRAERLEALDAERARLANELAEIRRLAREPLPVVYLGGDESVDLVVDPQSLSRTARLGRSGLDDRAFRPTRYTTDEPERIDR